MKYILTFLITFLLSVSVNAFDYKKVYDSTFLLHLGRASGTGFAVGEDLVLTNRHVCEAVNYNGVMVFNKNLRGKALSYKLSKNSDLCLLKFDSPILKPLKLSSKGMELHTKVLITGAPRAKVILSIEGIVSEELMLESLLRHESLDCDKLKLEIDKDLFYMQFKPTCDRYDGIIPEFIKRKNFYITALLAGGASGSSVVNKKSEVVGIVFAVINMVQDQNVGYAVALPVEYIKDFLNRAEDIEWTKIP